MAANMSDPVVQAIVAARVSLLFNQPFFGNLATRMELIDATKWCKTAATDGRKLYYNREFIKSLTPDELLFLIGHEVMHCVYDHLGRKGSREHKLWNMANDYIVNYTLVKEKLGEFDDEFIQLARSVYMTNDKRAEIKREINEASGSELIEEKSYA